MTRTGGQPDEAFDRLMARAVARQVDRSADSCPQAEEVAAWFDRSLAADDALAVETHLASCARCQALAADLARSEPEVVYARPLPLPRPWTWHLRWMTPLAAAAVIALAVAVPLLRQSAIAPSQAVPEGRVAMATPTPEPRDATPSAPLPEAAPSTSAAREQAARAAIRQSAPADKSLADRVRATQPAEAPAAPAAPAPAPPPPPAPSLAAADRHADAGRPAPSGGVAGGVVGGVVGGVAAEAAGAGEALKPARTELADAAANQPQMVKARVPAPAEAPAGARPAAAKEENETRAAFRRSVQMAAASSAELAADGRSGWRIGRPGFIHHTVDVGANWTEQVLPGSAVITAVSPVSAQVCWAVGTGGVVVRTIDGSTWQPVSSPTTSNLVHVRAEGADLATIRTDDGVIYRTSNGGASWQRR